MKQQSSNIQSYPIPDLSTKCKQDAFIADEMFKAEAHFKEQLGIPKEVPAPPIRSIRIEDLPTIVLHVNRTFFIGLVVTTFVVVGCFLVYLAFTNR